MLVCSMVIEMLKIISKANELCFSDLMLIYEEGNRENAEKRYGRLDKNAALIMAEQDFYTYLHDVFFVTQNAFYALWVENGQYVSALRMEPYQDGFLLEALETRPGYRGRGFAKRLINSVLAGISGRVYSHVDKGNIASLAVHDACGFRKISDTAIYVDGSTAPWCLTLCRDGKNV